MIDPFKQLKYKAFDESEITMIAIADFLNPQFSKKELDNKNLKTLFIQILKVLPVLLYMIGFIIFYGMVDYKQ